MALINERRAALELRKQGKSYNQIKRELGVSKSTLSLWLRSYPLTKSQMRALRDLNAIRIERFRETMRMKRERKLLEHYQAEKLKWLPLSKRELYIAGLFLYWGEGTKAGRGTVCISNTDPKVMQFSLRWLTEALEIPREKIKVCLHLYNDMTPKKEITYWEKILDLPQSQFDKPYIKQSFKNTIDRKGFGHGTCGLRISSVELKGRIMMAIKGIADHYSLNPIPVATQQLEW